MIQSLKNKLRYIYDWLTDPLYLEYSIGDRRKAKITSITLLLFTILGVWETVNYGNSPIYVSVFLFLTFLLSRVKNYKIAAFLLILILCIPSLMVVLAADAEMLTNRPLRWLLLPIIIASFLFSMRGLFIVIAGIGVGIIGINYLNPDLSTYIYSEVSFLFATSLLIAVVAYQRDLVELEREEELKHLIQVARREVEVRRNVEKTLQYKTAQLEDLYGLTLQMTAELDVQNVLNMIVDNGLRILGGDDGGVFLYDAQEEVLTLVASSEKDEGKIVYRVIPRGAGIIGQVWEQETSLVIPDYQAWNGRIQKVADTISQKSFIATPLKWQGETPGVLILSSDQANIFAHEDLNIMNLLATQATIALKNAQLNTQILNNTERLEKEVKEREQVEIALRDSQKMLRTILDSIPIRVFWKDLDLNYLGCNQPFAEDVGLDDVAKIVGKNAFDLAEHDEDAVAYRAQDHEMIQTLEPKLNIIQSQDHPDGQSTWQKVNKLPLFDHRGELIGLIGTYEDITELVQAQEQLQQYTKELEFTNRELQKFAYVASHDLQEPLRKIQTFADRFHFKYSEQLDQHGLDYLARMQNSAARMQILIQDLLAYSRVTMGSLEAELVDLAGVVHEVLEDLETRIEEKEAKIIVGQLPTIEADPVQMKQLFLNLISNALKFTHEDQAPRVEIRAVEIRNNLWQVTVQDNGIGFDEKYEERIFGVFQRLHTNQTYKGTGIGLALCKQVVEQHLGRIHAKSQLGEGAAFIVTLPSQQPQAGDGQSKY